MLEDGFGVKDIHGCQARIVEVSSLRLCGAKVFVLVSKTFLEVGSLHEVCCIFLTRGYNVRMGVDGEAIGLGILGEKVVSFEELVCGGA